MGKIVVIEHLTLDGVMQAPGRPDEDTRGGFEHGGWAQERNDPAMAAAMGERMGESWALLAGRRTYVDFASFWPKQEPNPFTDALNRVQKYVVSATLEEPLEWVNSVLLKGDPVTAIEGLKGGVDENLVVFGSGVLVQALMRADLVDEFVLQIHPLVLGAGRRLFEDSTTASLRLVDSVTTATGVVIAIYGAR
ncbi:dihydrofolate reductase family protein [Actinomadura rudentiformis]|uniref:Dihydrofolate reductase family protein n=1 Tax=Actinomadura rudentiformis TaxID=359158 RepID=A0A6H9YNQ4_9ACTN|nr:dihydrofolate reductase family protein [Actinomadura rudentiformis]KAB2345097.1 dihydrofolate reductase family protein [Actinomadura rudentiformis]